MRRFLLACALSTITAGGAWALPTADGAPTSTPEVVDDDVDIPVHATPELSAARLVGADVASMPESAVEPSLTEPSHLTDASPAPIAAPAQIVTTTTTTAAPAPPPTAPPPTAPPATAPPATAAPAPGVAFTASQAYGSCSEPVPYDIFSGTATPGTTVSVSSPYGSGSAVADSHGHWERTVEFPTAPRGQTFSVLVSGAGGSTTLPFTATGGEGGHT